MHDPTNLKSQRRRDPRPPRHRHRRHWCCSFSNPPLSPENPALPNSRASSSSHKRTQPPSSYSSPRSQTQKPTPLARRILSPGRVSPISDHPAPLLQVNPRKQTPPKSPPPPPPPVPTDGGDLRVFDVRLNLKGKDGKSLVLELSSEVLTANSLVFADLIADCRRNQSGLCRIEVPGVENLNAYRETIELMFEDDISKKLIKIGGFRAIDILEVAASIKFLRGVSSCLRYIEAIPWTEQEEEKLREFFRKTKIEDDKTADILDRLSTLNSAADSQPTLTMQLIQSITTSTDANARTELKSMVRGLLSKSSVYGKNIPDLNKADIFAVCHSCLGSLVTLLEEASFAKEKTPQNERGNNNKPLLERVSTQVDNLNWLLDILLDRHMAEDFVDLWANHEELLELHEKASPMVRYELSRVSAMLFIAISTRRLHCPWETRLGLLRSWLRPMLSDFGWLQRCKKGLDMKELEGALGQALLTLPLKEQYPLFMDWFTCFSKQGNECPNLSKAFQVWWRRSFLRGSETFGIESR